MSSLYARFIRQIFRGKYITLWVLLVLQICAGTIPVIIAWLNGRLIHQISMRNPSLYDSNGIGYKLIVLIVVVSSCIALNDLLTVLQNFCSEYLQDLFRRRIQSQIMITISSQETIRLFESPADNNLIAVVKQNADRVSAYISITSQVLVTVFNLIAALLLGFFIVWWIPIVLFITMAPFVYVRTKNENKIWNAKVDHGHIFNQLDLYERILTSEEFAKELRLYQMKESLLDKWENVYNKFFKFINNLRIKSSFTICFWSFLSGVGPLASFWYVAYDAIMHDTSLGKVSFLLGVIIQLNGSLTCLMYHSSDIFRAFLAIKPILSLLSIKPEQPIAPTYYSKNEAPLLLFENVDFCYPGSKEYVIKNFNLSIQEGQSIAIVGENGSGKSTLFKLIGRLHIPTSGNIYWRGQNIASLPFNQYRSYLSTLFQDFAKFPLSVRENIVVSPNNIPSDETIAQILKDVGLSFLQHQLDKILSKRVDHGIDLSGGQWQRLALARFIANIGDSQLLMLDEPTSALDPSIEHEILTLLYRLITHKTSVVVSHRLSLCKFVSNIIVLKQGVIVEQGDHGTLLNSKFEYYKMFQKQASWYKQ